MMSSVLITKNDRSKWVHRMIKVNPESGRGICRNCGDVPIIAKRNSGRKNSLRYSCGIVETKWKKVVRVRLGISDSDVSKLILGQGGVCPICLTPLVSMAEEKNGIAVVGCLDHDHETNKVRGVLCSPCNLAIGKLRDSPEAAERAAIYLRKHT